MATRSLGPRFLSKCLSVTQPSIWTWSWKQESFKAENRLDLDELNILFLPRIIFQFFFPRATDSVFATCFFFLLSLLLLIVFQHLTRIPPQHISHPSRYQQHQQHFIQQILGQQPLYHLITISSHHYIITPLYHHTISCNNCKSNILSEGNCNILSSNGIINSNSNYTWNSLTYQHGVNNAKLRLKQHEKTTTAATNNNINSYHRYKSHKKL